MQGFWYPYDTTIESEIRSLSEQIVLNTSSLEIEEDVITIVDYENDKDSYSKFIDESMTGNEKYLQICILKNLVLNRRKSHVRPQKEIKRSTMAPNLEDFWF